MRSLGAAMPAGAVRSRGAGATAGGALLVSGLTPGGTLASAGGGTSAAAVRLGPCAGGLGIARTATVAAAAGAGGSVATTGGVETAASGAGSSSSPPTSEESAACEDYDGLGTNQ